MIGTLAGSYRIVDTISVGGMGTVYRAEHTLLGRPAAVKVLNPEMSTSRDIVNRFFNEARATTSIKHPGIIEVFDFGYLESGHAYLVMELLEGAPLSTRNRARPRIPEFEAAAILRLICSALTAAHAKGIVHRDLKPDNIFLIPDPDSALGERPKLLDFGIAKLTDIGLAGSATKTGAVMGTPTYMSPEQCRGTGDVDHRADLYSLGCIFYELLTGRPPFIDRGAGELIGAHLYMQPEPPSRHAPGISPDVEALIMALLAKNPAERPQTAAELAQRLLPIAARGGLVSAVSWDNARASMPYVAAQPGDATRYPTPAHTPMPTPGSMPMPTPGSMPMPTPGSVSGRMPAHTPMPTPGAMPMPTPIGAPIPTPMGAPMPTGNVRTPATTTDPTTLSGAASQVQAPRGSSKRIFAIAGAVVIAGGIAIVVAMSGRGGTTSVQHAAHPTTAEPATPAAGNTAKRAGSTKPGADTTKPATADSTQPGADTTKPADSTQPGADTTKPADSTQPGADTTTAADSTQPGADTTTPATADSTKPDNSMKPATADSTQPGADTTKAADSTQPGADTTKPATADSTKPADTTKPSTAAAKPTKPATAATKPKPTTKPKPGKPATSDNPLLETDI